jgi:hypothetical protein
VGIKTDHNIDDERFDRVERPGDGEYGRPDSSTRETPATAISRYSRTTRLRP